MRMHFLLVLATGFLVAAEKPKGPDEIIDEIQKMGGLFCVDEKRPGQPIILVYLAEIGVGDAWLSGLEAVPT